MKFILNYRTELSTFLLVPIHALRWYRFMRYDGTVSPILSMKVLHMECGGLVIYHLKLERGSLVLPCSLLETEKPLETRWSNLTMMVEGISLDHAKTATRWKPHTSVKRMP